MVDFDAIAVIESGVIQYYILYPASTTFTDDGLIEVLITENPEYSNSEGVDIGTKVEQAEAIYGNATLYFNTANESREFIRFENQPSTNIYFQPTASNSDFAGVYLSVNSEYNETEQFHDDAVIKSVQVICLSNRCNRE